MSSPGISISNENDEFVLRTELVVSEKLNKVFDFFSDAGNLQLLTPDYLKFEITSPLPIEMKPGALIDYRLKLHGIPFNWQTVIPEWSPPEYFVDRQKKGPYRYWIHRHEFEEHGEGTLVRDIVRYKVPGGAVINRLFVEKDLYKIFDYRSAKMVEQFGVPAS